MTRKRNPGDQIFYARGRRRDTRSDDQVGYIAPERPRRARTSSKASPVTTAVPAEENDTKID